MRLLLLLFQDRSFEVHPVRRSAASWDRKCVPWVFRAASRAEARAWTDVIKRIAAALKSSPPLSESMQWSYHPTASSSSRRSSEEPGEEEHRKLKTPQRKEPVKQHQRRSNQPKHKQPERWESEVDELFSGGSGSTATALTKKAKSGKTTRGARRLNTKTKEQQQQQRSQQQQQQKKVKAKAKTNSPQWTAEVDELFGSPLVRPPPRQKQRDRNSLPRGSNLSQSSRKNKSGWGSMAAAARGQSPSLRSPGGKSATSILGLLQGGSGGGATTTPPKQRRTVASEVTALFGLLAKHGAAAPSPATSSLSSTTRQQQQPTPSPPIIDARALHKKKKNNNSNVSTRAKLIAAAASAAVGVSVSQRRPSTTVQPMPIPTAIPTAIRDKPTPLAVFIAFTFVDRLALASAKMVCRRWNAAVKLQKSPLDLRLLRGIHPELHRNIRKFDSRIAALSAEMLPWRTMAIQHIRAVIVAIWPGATIEVFGSFSYGLASPQSDVDIAVQNAVRSADSSPHAVLLLAQALAGLAWIQSVKSLPNTGVPLVTAVTIDNLKIDISFATDKFRYATGTL